MIADHEVARYSSALFDYVIQFKKQFFIFDDSRYWFSPRSHSEASSCAQAHFVGEVYQL
jgi:hypothetical protein